MLVAYHPAEDGWVSFLVISGSVRCFFPLLVGFTAPEGLSKDGLCLEIQRIRNLVFPMIQRVIRQ